MITVEMTWDELRTLVYGMYVRDFYDYGGDLDGMVPVCYAEFLDNEYTDTEYMEGMLFWKDVEMAQRGWWDIYLTDPLVKEVKE